jgi:hypothetical protein
MQEDIGLTPTDRELEASLASLRPSSLLKGRDQMMFAAGYARARRQGHLWRGVAACLVVSLAASIVWRSGALKTEASPDWVVVASRPHVPAAESVRQIPGIGCEAEALRLRQAILERGMDALPAWQPVSCGTKDVQKDGRKVEDPTSSI